MTLSLRPMVRVLVSLTLVVAGLIVTPTPSGAAGVTAVNLFGQGGNYTANASGNSSTRLNGPSGTVYDSEHARMFVSDQGNNRVMVYELGASPDAVADYTLGQTGFGVGASGLSASTLDRPEGMAYDGAADRLYVADGGNARILVYDTAAINSGEDATVVLGQTNFASEAYAATATGLGAPRGLALSADKRWLLATDENHNRVLVYDTASLSNGVAATYVLGQNNFTDFGAGRSASQLTAPQAIAVDPVTNKAYVSDSGGRRIVVFNLNIIGTGMSATQVIGQQDFTADITATSQQQFQNATAMTVAGDRLFVTDRSAHRILAFRTADVANYPLAIAVIGQPDYTSSTINNGGRSASSLANPSGVTFDRNRWRIAVADYSNNRVLTYDASIAGATLDLKVEPTLSFTVAARTNSCNGVAPSGTSTPTEVRLGAISGGASASAAQDLTVSTNAAAGFTVSHSGTAFAGPKTITSVAGSNATPAAFGAGELFGYTTNLPRFGGGLWAAVSGTPATVLTSAGPATSQTGCVAYQVQTVPSTPAGTYSATITYTVVPTF